MKNSNIHIFYPIKQAEDQHLISIYNQKQNGII